jgi:hypothetical protein
MNSLHSGNRSRSTARLSKFDFGIPAVARLAVRRNGETRSSPNIVDIRDEAHVDFYSSFVAALCRCSRYYTAAVSVISAHFGLRSKIDLANFTVRIGRALGN